MRARWLRHAVSLPVVVFGAWYGVEHGSSGAFLLAGAGALAWFVWPEASRFLAWRRRRRAEVARARPERAMSQADRDVAKAETIIAVSVRKQALYLFGRQDLYGRVHDVGSE